MTKFFVSGLINIETTLQVDGFPIPYHPSNYRFFGIQNSVAGVGYNITKALTVLGNEVNFHTMIGTGPLSDVILKTLSDQGIRTDGVWKSLKQTAQSVILYDTTGKRSIFTDLKNVQEQVLPELEITRALRECDIAVLCNVNFSRPLLRFAQQAGRPVATDVHTISALDDPYNEDFMAAADILFMSDEQLPESPDRWIRHTANTFSANIIVIGLGAEGALLYERRKDNIHHIPAAVPRSVVNTIGSGDALFSSFLHFYFKKGIAVDALRLAVLFAGYKIGENGAAAGFLDEDQLLKLFIQSGG